MGSIVEDAVEAFEAAQRGSQEGRARLEELWGALAALADEGDVEEQNALGGIALEYFDDPETALRYWTLAADRKHPGAQRGLGHLYGTGRGVPQDVEKAVELFRPAAAAGDHFAMFNLALLRVPRNCRENFHGQMTHGQHWVSIRMGALPIRQPASGTENARCATTEYSAVS